MAVLRAADETRALCHVRMSSHRTLRMPASPKRAFESSTDAREPHRGTVPVPIQPLARKLQTQAGPAGLTQGCHAAWT